MKSGFLRVAAVAPAVNVADVDFNVGQIINHVKELAVEGVELIVFPEMSITGYTCGDLFNSSTLVEAARDGLARIVTAMQELSDVTVIVGLPIDVNGALYNCAAVIRDSRINLIPKSYIPNYNEFYERRWWRPCDGLNEGSEIEIRDAIKAQININPTVFDVNGAKVGVEICEDLWVPVPPSCRIAMAGAQVICNLSASDDLIGKYNYLTSLISQQSARCVSAYVYAGAGFGESSTDLTFDGKAIIAENGKILRQSPRWSNSPSVEIADIDIMMLDNERRRMTTYADCASSELSHCKVQVEETMKPATAGRSDLKYREVDRQPFVPADDDAIDRRCDEIINIQVAGLARRLDFIKARTLVVGISGGLDSTLALLVAAKTFDRLGLDRVGIIGVTMPGFGTTGRTHRNAVTLMKSLGVTIKEVSIVAGVTQHFEDIGHDMSVHDTTYENSQARYRTMLLMDIANQTGGIVLGTGDLSELALGWATYNGDQMSMYGVNASIPKTLVRYLVRWFARRSDNPLAQETLNDIIDTPISPELIPADENGNIKQKTEDLVGPYELHDFFLYYVLRHGFSPRRIYLLALKAFDGTLFTPDVVRKWMKVFFRRFFNQQFKRSCMPDGPKVGSVCLSPRGDWRMPSDASSAVWMKEIDEL